MTTLLKTFSSIGEKFICGTVQGLNWFFSQMVVLVVLETILYITGIPLLDSMTLKWYYWGILLVSSIFVFAYTMIFNWFYAFIPIKYFIKTCWIPYLIYVGIWEIGISCDWDIQDRLLVYFIPLCGMFFTYGVWKLAKQFKGLLTLFLHIKGALDKITLKKVLLLQSLGIVLMLLVEYYNLHPIATLLGGSDKWDFTSTLIWILLVVFPTIYAMYYKVKKVWLPIFIAVFPFILIGILAISILINDL